MMSCSWLLRRVLFSKEKMSNSSISSLWRMKSCVNYFKFTEKQTNKVILKRETAAAPKKITSNRILISIWFHLNKNSKEHKTSTCPNSERNRTSNLAEKSTSIKK